MTRIFPNLPNILTSLRLLLAPVLAVLVLAGHHRMAFGVFVFAGLSDAADGFLAKRFDLGTAFGRILDPVADKLLMLASFLALAAVGAVPVWLTVLVIARDLGIVAGALSAWALDLPLAVAPLQLGKLCTAMQIGYIALVLFAQWTKDALPDVLSVLAFITAGITLASGLNYAALWLRALITRAGRTA